MNHFHLSLLMHAASMTTTKLSVTKWSGREEKWNICRNELIHSEMWKNILLEAITAANYV